MLTIFHCQQGLLGWVFLGVFQPHSGMKLVRKMKSEDHVKLLRI
ncbi:hypothetical protein C789_5500 [Microcystis aeruginosa FACHB-905 = DIANCHI905]|nr:hypothetical protein C789_5500 [Microcystis aeruginosa FACHB-905 = DIANCHI905]